MRKAEGDRGETAWVEVLDHLGEAVIVLDEQRTLRHVNHAARRLLGYEKDQKIGGRCKLTTRGVDCENACPLTFALEHDLDRVEDFATAYTAADGRSVSLSVTVIPFVGESGEFKGAVEILRPTEPRSGFFLSGTSTVSETLRERVSTLARAGGDVCLVGEPTVCLDVARALHRFSGLPEELFLVWEGSWSQINPWPAGTVYSYEEGADCTTELDRPEGWRIVRGSPESPGQSTFEILVLPAASELEEDLSRIIVSWIEELAPRATVAPGALETLVRVARDRGFSDLGGVLSTALAVAGEHVDESHLPVDGYRTAFIDELLQAPKPLAELEKRLLREVLERCDWRMQEAADRVGVSRVTLWRKMKDLGIEKNS
ncbi:MAG: PAS domain-containing protein [Acidobacteria bacterium]|nr:PAS domain-containing protein [Acidobacteriota bacterium]